MAEKIDLKRTSSLSYSLSNNQNKKMQVKFLLGSFLFVTTKARCPDGYNEEEIPEGFSCKDINECDEGTHNCHLDANCLNTIGSFACVCKQGKRSKYA